MPFWKKAEVVVRIDGMMCEHCAGHVREALLKLPGVKSVEVSLQEKKATIKSKKPLELALIQKAVEEAGYKIGE